MIAMIDRALLYKERYDQAMSDDNRIVCNQYKKYADADKYSAWREVCVWFTGLFDILNSTDKRLNTDYYSDNLEFLKRFLKWFEDWKTECISFRAITLPENCTAYQAMTGFFTAEATEDCLSMVRGIIYLSEYYCGRKNINDVPVYFLPRRISQDLVENGFSRIRLAVGHGRLDHKSTLAATVEVNLMKEIKCHDRSIRKRNANSSIKDNSEEKSNSEELCTEYAKNLRKKILAEKSLLFNQTNPYTWMIKDGKDFMHFNDV